MFGYMPLIEAAILTLLGLLAGKSLHLVPEFFHKRLDFMDLADFPHIFPYFPVIFLVKHIKTSFSHHFPWIFLGAWCLAPAHHLRQVRVQSAALPQRVHQDGEAPWVRVCSGAICGLGADFSTEDMVYIWFIYGIYYVWWWWSWHIGYLITTWFHMFHIHTGWASPVMWTLVYKPWNNPH